MTGAVHVTFDNLPPSIELIRAGKLRALAVTSTTRSQAMPELPAGERRQLLAPNVLLPALLGHTSARRRRLRLMRWCA
jgi:Tripartite tricarboxylate transporter family receptor